MLVYGEIKPLEEMLKADLIVYSIDKEDLIRKCEIIQRKWKK